MKQSVLPTLPEHLLEIAEVISSMENSDRKSCMEDIDNEIMSLQSIFQKN